jgi:hypothetical protein
MSTGKVRAIYVSRNPKEDSKENLLNLSRNGVRSTHESVRHNVTRSAFSSWANFPAPNQTIICRLSGLHSASPSKSTSWNAAC